MGKQLQGTIRAHPKKNIQFRIRKDENIRKEIDAKWNPYNALITPKISENGHALIIIKQKDIESKILCTGFTRIGNKYTRLIKALRSKGYIPIGRKVRGVMRDKKFMNVKVNVRKESFMAGDRIIIDIDGKKTIKKGFN